MSNHGARGWVVVARSHLVNSCMNSGLATFIFIFCFGVRSPWRMTAMTQRSSSACLLPSFLFTVVLGGGVMDTGRGTRYFDKALRAVRTGATR